MRVRDTATRLDLIHRIVHAVAVVWLICAQSTSRAADGPAAEAPERFNARFQATYVWQHKPQFRAAYSGAKSLRTDTESSYSFTTGAAFGLRVTPDTEIYLNPEAAQGRALSDLTGLAGFTNGEIARTAGPHLKWYLARGFVRHHINFGGARAAVESDANQLGGSVDRRRLTITAGVLSLLDLFDDNAYSHDTRTQFMNWSMFAHGSYDFAADARGYTHGIALEYFHDDWALRYARMAQPRDPNGAELVKSIGRIRGEQIELEHAHQWRNRAGRVHVLYFRNVANMARYDDALALAEQTGAAPSLDAARFGLQTKQGWGLSVEQAIGDGVGLWARLNRADGQTETYAFTTIDASISAGLLIEGAYWGREADRVGLAFSRNELSSVHRRYLATGGVDFFIGDGKIKYRPEAIMETFYAWRIQEPGAWFSIDYQYIRNPAYNADRGPAHFVAGRIHLEF